MNDHREIVLGPRKWRQAQPRAWRWDVSAKGNATTRIEDVRLVVMQNKFRGRNEGKWTWSSLGESVDGSEAHWQGSGAWFDTEDEAKTSALHAAGVGSRPRTPVAPDATEAAPPPATPTRRIVL